MEKENSISITFLTAIDIMELGKENGFKAAEFMISTNKTYSTEENSRIANNMVKVLYCVSL